MGISFFDIMELGGYCAWDSWAWIAGFFLGHYHLRHCYTSGSTNSTGARQQLGALNTRGFITG